MPNEPDFTSEGKRHIERWEQAKKSLYRAKAAMNSAECELMNAASALSKWILPEDAKPGEKICVWHLDSLIQVEIPIPEDGASLPDPQITIRKRGRDYSLSPRAAE